MSRKVNGVSELHSRLVRDSLFPEFDKLFPGRFCNVTNGISPRLWLCSPTRTCAGWSTGTLGDKWRGPLDLTGLQRFADDGEFRAEFAAVKLSNKRRLADAIAEGHRHYASTLRR